MIERGKRRPARVFLRLVIGLVVSGAVAGAVAAPAAAAPRSWDFATIRDAQRPSEGRLLDRDGNVLHERRIDPRVRRFAWVPLDEVAPALVAAVLRAEDRRFYAHRGVDLRAMVAAGAGMVAARAGVLAARAEWTRGVRRGGSTISMQLAGMLDPALKVRQGRRSLRQKAQQARAAWRLETEWSKAEILEAYLNLAYFRGEIQGIGAAAALLFGKAPHGLNEAESAVLAAPLRAPNAPADVWQRRARQLTDGLDAAAVDRALQIASLRRVAPRRAQGAPHLAARAWSDTGTGDVRTTLAANVQDVATDSLRQNLLALRERNVADGAVLVVDNRTGEVLAYVGGVRELSRAAAVDAVRARRQAGSTLKPFLYQLAIEQRLLSATTLLADEPLELRVGSGLYRPQNYDGRFRGLVSARIALAGSLNIPAVRVLSLVGEETFLHRLRALGFRGLDEAGDYYGPSLALGSSDVTLWELVQAYRQLANPHDRRPLRWQPIDAGTPTGPRPADATAPAAFVVADILADRDSRGTTFGTEGPLATRYWAAVKTGTSKEMRDNWCIGFSSRYTVGVWVGNLNGEPMHDVSGIAGAAPVWREVMDFLHHDAPLAAPLPPVGVQAVELGDERSGVPQREWLLDGTAPPRFAPHARPAQIVAPTAGAMIALDPDIPPANQRITLLARGARADLRWQIDDEELGTAAQPQLWSPRPGRHRIRLIAADRSIVDEAEIAVRGGGSTS